MYYYDEVMMLKSRKSNLRVQASDHEIAPRPDQCECESESESESESAPTSIRRIIRRIITPYCTLTLLDNHLTSLNLDQDLHQDLDDMFLRAPTIRRVLEPFQISTAANAPKTQRIKTSAARRPPSPHVKNPDHVAKTAIDDKAVYVLALQTDRDFHQRINDLRKQYFPPRLNKVGAHITLFQALPGSQLDSIVSDLLEIAHPERRFQINTVRARLMPYGVALDAKINQARRLWKTLHQKWGPAGADFLSKQDQQFDAYYTIQNKVEKDVAIQTWEKVRQRFKCEKGWAIGLTLYKYTKGGQWTFHRTFDFAKPVEPQTPPADVPPFRQPGRTGSSHGPFGGTGNSHHPQKRQVEGEMSEGEMTEGEMTDGEGEMTDGEGEMTDGEQVLALFRRFIAEGYEKDRRALPYMGRPPWLER